MKTMPIVLVALSLSALALVPALAAADGDMMPNTAGGGGWFWSGMYKDSFGLYLNGVDRSDSWLTFQGRDAMVRVQAYAFTNIAFEEEMGYWSAHAWGWAYVNGMEGYWFHLLVTDKGKGSTDVFHLWVYHDDGNGMMDETTPTYDWMADGLDGGNLWVVPPEM